MNELLLDENYISDYEDTIAEDPVPEDPVPEDPVPEEPVPEDPVSEDPVPEDPVSEDPVAEDPVVEDQEVISILKNIDEKIGDLNVRDSKQNEVDDSIDSNDGVLLRSSEVVSSNIINKPINDYDVSESLLLMIWLSLAVAGIVVMIKRSIFKWT